MATATKTPAKRAASQTRTASAVKRARADSAAKSAAKTAGKSVSASVKAGAQTAPRKTAKRVSNGAAGPVEPAAVRTSRSRAAKGQSGHSGNGELPAELAGNEQAFEADTLHDGEVVRKSRASVDTEVAVPVQIGGLAPEVTRPAYWDKACADLVKRDRILKKLIPKFGPVHLLSRGDSFVTLARSVVGQQISVATAQAVWGRIESACPKLVPQQIIKLGAAKLIACGLSKRKTEYILDLAQHFVSGALHIGKWASMDDEAVIAELTQIRGIGRWTAEMFLIFNLSRPDVLPLDDLGLIRAISVNYFSGEPVTRSEAREVAANWEPWRTVATWYMWRSLDPLAVEE
ncbi:DNA-3-methyladenine glycosylase family protein [Paraburkholderia rhizosphaerae]|uniref:DNA-3-methyladenine glycosylase II n=1 Tax=Paraburkholderia rhizosphaerae TaxID=480658 RepID=A0A4V3HE70_9BURK|nr:DNA-3-methyladenine glycosylase [Paraburkholderia rhizosphaerae]TDY45055.1 DNA-3-methyladenine glycosylase II [Paraburkholderia rhizosphaerae]